ncbi:MAG: LEA type 2 family protein [Fermentimonas sp.]
MNTIRNITVLLIVLTTLTRCDVFNSVSGAYNLSQSEYKYHSLSNIQLAGINLGNSENISLSNLAAISTVLAGSGTKQTIPFNMNLNMDVKNPNQKVAYLDALDYAIALNDMELVEGRLDSPIRIEPGETKTISIPVSVDLKLLMNRYSQDRVVGEMSSFLGITKNETTVGVKIWPRLTVGRTLLKVPAPIPVEFKFGGR